MNREFKQARDLVLVSLYVCLFFFIVTIIYVYGSFAYMYISPSHEYLMAEEAIIFICYF